MMHATTGRPSEIALPAAAIAAFRRALTDELDADAAARVLRIAGHDAGDEFFRILSESGGRPVSELEASAFWRQFSRLFSSRGWGSFTHADVHPGIATLTSSDWAEADAAGSDGRPSCFFTTGLLANLLGKVAEGDVSVMEVECRSRGDHACRFLFGSPEALRGVYDLLLEGASTESAVSQLA